MRELGRLRVLCAVCIVALGLIGGTAPAAGPTMFDEGRAPHAFTAIQDKIGHKLRVLTLRITADELSVGIPNVDAPGEVETWEVSHKGGLAAALGLDWPRRQGSSRASTLGGTIEESLVDIDAAGLAIVPKLAAAALARARLQQPGRVTEMEILRLPKFLGPAARDPYWHVHVKGIEEEADISAKLTGELTVADLRRTKRAENLNLLAGGPDFGEMVQNIRSELKDQWIFHYIEIEKTAINFDVHLASVKSPQIIRFTATLSEIKTYNTSMPHMAFPGTPTDDPFSLSDVDLSLLTKLEEAAEARLQIADGIVQRVILSKPHRENGGAVEWEVQVRSGHGPLFWTPNSPPVEEGSVTFDTKGNVVRTKYPPGHGAQANLFDPVSLQKAIAKIAERLGPHVQLTELRIIDQRIDITARDPQDPKKFVAFAYQDEDVARASGASQTMANAFGAGPDWLWDLALLQPSVVQSFAALEQQTMARLGITHGAIVRITISKDKMFHPSNDKVLVEIRASGDGKENEWVTFDLAGSPPKLQTPPSGIRVVGPSTSERPNTGARVLTPADPRCFAPDPELAIAGCTVVIQSGEGTPEGRARAFHNRGLGYARKGQYLRAIEDFGQANRLNPKDAETLYNRGLCYYYMGQFDPAIRDNDEAIRLDPNYVLAFNNRGIAYAAKLQYDRAIEDYDQAIRLDPKSLTAFFNRGIAYAARAQYDRAITDYDQAIGLDPKSPNVFLNRGVAYAAKGQYDRAIADYDRAIGLDPKNAAAYASRGHAFHRLGAFDRAIADFTQTLQLNPNNAAVYTDRARAYVATRDYNRAIADFNVALSSNPKDARAIFDRGRAFFYGGSIDKAQADFRKSREIDPTFLYSAIWLVIAERRGNLPSAAAPIGPPGDATAWPASVLRFVRGELTQAELVSAAANSDAVTQAGQVCEADFYGAEIALAQRHEDDAISLFKLAASSCPPTFIESEGARAELAIIGASASVPLQEASAWTRPDATAAPAELSGAAAFAKGDEAYDRGDYAEAMRWSRVAADQGSAEAQTRIGVLYANGKGVAQDYAEAMRWYHKAADQGFANAQANIGILCAHGEGVAEDHAEAMRWFRKAAEQGHISSQFLVGFGYEYGKGVAQDDTEAMRWYRRAADQGDADAQFAVGVGYDDGKGVAQDYGEAMRWYRKAANQGNASAAADIGYFYAHGQGVAQDYGEAMRWYRKAADQKNTFAQWSIGKLYERGDGVPRDLAQARIWMEKAAAGGDAEAKKWLQENNN